MFFFLETGGGDKEKELESLKEKISFKLKYYYKDKTNVRTANYKLKALVISNNNLQTNFDAIRADDPALAKYLKLYIQDVSYLLADPDYGGDEDKYNYLSHISCEGISSQEILEVAENVLNDAHEIEEIFRASVAKSYEDLEGKGHELIALTKQLKELVGKGS